MRFLIVDDERPARDKLLHLLRQHGEADLDQASDGLEALDKITSWKPDAVFLDVQMPEANGLEVAASLPDPQPMLVFVTAYDKFTLQAFDANAIDYLLKPFDEGRFVRALQRIRNRFNEKTASARLPREVAPIERLLVPDRGKLHVIALDHILWLETADNYVMIYTTDGRHIMRQTLGGLLLRLGDRFMRCHRRAAVRLAAVEQTLPLERGDCELVLTGGVHVPCSRQYRADVLARLALR